MEPTGKKYRTIVVDGLNLGRPLRGPVALPKVNEIQSPRDGKVKIAADTCLAQGGVIDRQAVKRDTLQQERPRGSSVTAPKVCRHPIIPVRQKIERPVEEVQSDIGINLVAVKPCPAGSAIALPELRS